MQNLHRLNLTSILLLLICLVSIISCESPNHSTSIKSENWGKKKYSLDLTLADAESRDKYDVNDIFDSVNYVPLQTTKECMFSTIDQLEVTDKYYFILDVASNSILAFDKNGAYKFKLKSTTIGSFTIDEHNERIVFLDKVLHKVFTYDFNGQLISTKTPLFNFSDLTYLDSDHIAYYRYFGNVNDIKFSPSNILIADTGYNIKHAFLPYDTTALSYTEVANGKKPFCKSNNTVYFAQPLDNKIFFNLNSNTLPEYFSINLPEKYSLPADFILNNKYRDKRRQYFSDNPDQVYLIQNIYIIDSVMTFELIAEKMRNIYLYDLKKKKAISTYNFLSGPKNSSLPLGMHFLAADDKSFYRMVPAAKLFNVKQAHQSQLNFETLPKNMQTFYQTQNNLSNPVIIRLFPKKDLSGLKKKA